MYKIVLVWHIGDRFSSGCRRFLALSGSGARMGAACTLRCELGAPVPAPWCVLLGVQQLVAWITGSLPAEQEQTRPMDTPRMLGKNNAKKGYPLCCCAYQSFIREK